MAAKMKAAVLAEPGKIVFEGRDVPAVQPHEVLLKVKRVGVCGSDVHYYKHGRIGDFVVRKPIILGHEASGIIEELGSEVAGLKVGDRVAVEPGYTCRKCRYCKSGLYNLCPDVVFLATPPIDGAFCQYLAWPADFCFRIPDKLTLDQAAMMEPTAVALWSCRRAPVQPGQTVVVFGCGPIGAMTIQVARAHGATTIFAVDLDDWRLEQAKKFGAHHLINARNIEPVEQIKQTISNLTGEDQSIAGCDVTFETAGATATTIATLAAVRPGGTAMLVGLPPEPKVSLDIVSAASKEISIKGQFRYANCYGPAISLTESGHIDPGAIVTHHMPLEKVQDALELASNPPSGTMKIMIDID